MGQDAALGTTERLQTGQGQEAGAPIESSLDLETLLIDVQGGLVIPVEDPFATPGLGGGGVIRRAMGLDTGVSHDEADGVKGVVLEEFLFLFAGDDVIRRRQELGSLFTQGRGITDRSERQDVRHGDPLKNRATGLPVHSRGQRGKPSGDLLDGTALDSRLAERQLSFLTFSRAIIFFTSSMNAVMSLNWRYTEANRT